jgi:hypothetical protein
MENQNYISFLLLHMVSSIAASENNGLTCIKTSNQELFSFTIGLSGIWLFFLESRFLAVVA